MAKYDQLPVFHETYMLLMTVFRDMNKVPRDVKYTLVENLKKELTDIIVLIYRANMVTNREHIIDEAREKLVKVQIQFRVLHDMECISTKLFALSCTRTESISRQLTAWLKYVERKNNTVSSISEPAQGKEVDAGIFGCKNPRSELCKFSGPQGE